MALARQRFRLPVKRSAYSTATRLFLRRVVRTWLIFALISLVGTPSTLSGQTREENWKRCDPGNPDDVIIGGCTAVIQSGQETDADLAVAFNGRGVAYDRKKDHDRAILDFSQVIRLDPNNAFAYNNRGNAYYGKKDYDRAIHDYDQAIRLDPNYALAFYNRGNAYYGKKDYDRAIQGYDQAIRLDPNYASAFNNRGFAYYGKKDYDRAIRDYDRAVRLDPNNAVAFTNRGFAYYGKKDYDRAIQDYDRAIRLDPNYAPRLHTRGIIQFCAGRFTAAAADLEKALNLQPSDAYHAVWLYVAQSRSGRTSTAWLEAASKRLDLAHWPGPVLLLYLGRATAESVLRAANDADPEKDRDQHGEAYFFLAENALRHERQTEATELFRKTMATGLSTNNEYQAAEAELKRLTTGVERR